MKVTILSSGFEPRFERLQPQRTLLEMGHQLERLGHTVSLISDGAGSLPKRDKVLGLPVQRILSVQRFYRHENPALLDMISTERPNLLLWHLSLSSLLHQDLRLPFEQTSAGILTSPIHRPRQILELGLNKISSNLDLVSVQLAGLLLPGTLIKKAITRSRWKGIITLSKATRDYLIEHGIPGEQLKVVPPGVSPAWLEQNLALGRRRELRDRYEFGTGDFVITYMGSPAPVRGLFTLLDAVESASQDHPNLKLMVLSRRTPDQWSRETARLEDLISKPGLEGRVHLVDGFLAEQDLIDHIQASDAVCLPFEMIPSDVPLSVLESMALGKAVITTDIGCLPELVGNEQGFLTRKGSKVSLAKQLDLVMSSNGLAAERGNKARRFIQDHRTWDRMGDVMQGAIVDLIGLPSEAG
jgi:glycosyltransferase involved in cell wall biosynthesis